uniref:inosine/xanthosine triphosphatase n=1 Tax=Craspedostauros australis TaxID=1486917 RepID=A0A7R9WWK8_9STRA|mmetsp:Transcript_24365/g.67864  ORF Transcript_24365/g.67864 Transcript_24365/m.67864 type:complete len:248 (+) Transcript_24365:112-855(+)|eukprot:CAMPEP_0198122328 /NCGR_PEP_ID=MMETSP1442-20131203/34512_1 /TAXON_ID= /ORGANISM="Craspedostauros australis, Strain CCMP3328" /LENGTH=247 /DNA_ID=CAMNT_0043781323 /DNA_START=81 /DNA_END=824 /DNA_ORIENTATION=-
MTLNVAVGSKNPCKIDAVRAALRKAMEAAASDTSDGVDDANKADNAPSNKSSIATLNLQGFSVESGVPDQPFGDAETCEGAKNRARRAHDAYKEQHGEEPDMAVGLEGGLEWFNFQFVDNDSSNKKDTLWCMAWMAIYGRRTPAILHHFQSKDCIGASQDAATAAASVHCIFGTAKTATFQLPTKLVDLIRDGMELGHADDKVFGRTNSKHGSGTVGVLTNNLIDRSHYYEHALQLALVPWIRPDVY